MSTEMRSLKMHPKLLMDVIKRQAGSLAKAVIEAVMNLIDAGATFGNVTLTRDKLVVEDNGRGIQSKEEIERFFETFGQPHDEGEKKIYGTFRIGRGQCMAFGKNIWRTHAFELVVDIDKNGTDYELKSDLPRKNGCFVTVELYKNLLPSELAETERVLCEWVKYSPVPIKFNGRLVSRDPAKDKWDDTTAEAYVRLADKTVLSIYNLGIHVMDLPASRFGTGGLVVSRQQLKVNFARNDIQSDCPVWKKIKPIVDTRATKRNKRATALDTPARQRLVDQLLRGEIPCDFETFKKMKLITAVNGQHFSLDQAISGYGRSRHITACPRNSLIGDKLFQQKLAFVMAEETLDRFGVESVDEFLDVVKRLCAKHISPKTVGKPKSFRDLTKGIDDQTHDILEEDRLTPRERAWLDVARAGYCTLPYGPSDQNFIRRRLVVGVSEVSRGWTDGLTYIAFERKFLAHLDFNLYGIGRLGRLLLHEISHGDNTTAEHTHGIEFYQFFHDNADALGSFNDRAFQCLPSILEKIGKKPNKRVLRLQDAEARTETALEKFPVAADTPRDLAEALAETDGEPESIMDALDQLHKEAQLRGESSPSWEVTIQYKDGKNSGTTKVIVDADNRAEAQECGLTLASGETPWDEVIDVTVRQMAPGEGIDD